jgi:hypothetical protein
MRQIILLGVGLLLAACGGAGQWNKTGATPEKAARDYAECRHSAELSLGADTAIDTDILATRSHDWQRQGLLRTKQSEYSDSNEARSGDFVERCMIGKGYTAAR